LRYRDPLLFTFVWRWLLQSCTQLPNSS